MKKILILTAIILINQFAFSQSDIAGIVINGKADAGKLFKAYMEPYAYALGDGLNNGWYNSAATHKLFGFDISISVSAVQIPDQSKNFDIGNLNLAAMTVASGGNMAPTAAGKNTPGPEMVIKDNDGNSVASFNTLNGIGFDVVPVPMAQIGFGILPYTDLIGRYIPEKSYANNDDGMQVGFWGVGVKHNFMKWMPVLKELPFDASVFGSYSELKGQDNINFADKNIGINDVMVTFRNQTGQLLRAKTTTSKFGLIISKKLSIFTAFAGIAQSTSESSIDLAGIYPVLLKVQSLETSMNEEISFTDPIALRYKTNNLSLDAGIRLKLSVISIFASVNKSEYTSFTAGLSLSVN